MGADESVTLSVREMIDLCVKSYQGQTAHEIKTAIKEVMDEHVKNMHPVATYKFWFVAGMLASGTAGAALVKLL